jgi:hypothetical protein
MAERRNSLAGIDVRALAAFRIVLAALLLFDLAQRSVDLTAFCTDDGVMSVAAARDWAGTPLRWSLHALSGGFAWQAALFAIAAVFAVLLLVGYWTRLATIVSWALLISLHNRTPLVTTGGDMLLRMLLFWGMFLPLAARWSVDAVTGRRRAEGLPLLPPQVFVSIATAAVLLQVAMMYLFSGLHKWNDIWLDGEALVRVFRNEMWSRPLGRALLDYPELLRGLTWGTLALELIGPVLLFVPWRTAQVRTIVALVLLLGHLFVELTMSVGMFSYVAAAGLVLFLPPFIWDALESGLVGGESFRRQIVVVASGQRKDSPPTQLANILCAFLLGYAMLWNVAGLPQAGGRLDFLMPRPIWGIAHATGLDQRWTMFAEPTASDGWFALWARLRDGQVVDLLRRGEAASDERPAGPTGDYRNQRWQKLFANLLEPHLVGHRGDVTAYFARQWNESHAAGEQVLAVDLYFFEQRFDPAGEPQEVYRQPLVRIELGAPEETDAFSELQQRFQ